jgi:hypothetical protein
MKSFRFNQSKAFLAIKHLGPYSEFQHGFPGGLGHGITIVSKDEKLMRAYFWSCMRGEEFFNAMTENDQNEFDKLWSTARANSLREN